MNACSLILHTFAADTAVSKVAEETKVTTETREGSGRERKSVERLEVEGVKEKTDLEIFQVLVVSPQLHMWLSLPS